jgi:pyruvate/2-oxoglutarate/acetoin dehydrogenase E1 component
MPDVRTSTYRSAVLEALFGEMRRDHNVILIGEDVGAAGGVFKQTDGLYAEFGAKRVIDTPISEAGAFGLAIGAAMTGHDRSSKSCLPTLSLWSWISLSTKLLS